MTYRNFLHPRRCASGRALPGGLPGPFPISLNGLPHFQCRSATLGPLPLRCPPSPPGMTLNLHLAAGFYSDGTRLSPSPLGPPPGVRLAVSLPWASDHSSEPRPLRPLTFLSAQPTQDLCYLRKTSIYLACPNQVPAPYTKMKSESNMSYLWVKL